MQLAGEDRDRMVRIETHSKATAKFIEDHETRLRSVETKQTRLMTSQAGLWTVITAVAAVFGYKVS
jgi:hypothetical protein